MNKETKILLLRYRRPVLVCMGGFFLLALLLYFCRNQTEEQAALNQTAKGTKEVIVIDPGHGGI